MKIQITDEYVMTSDPHNFILNEVVTVKTGNTAGRVWLKPIGYYQSVLGLIEALISLKMRQSTKRTLNAFI